MGGSGRGGGWCRKRALCCRALCYCSRGGVRRDTSRLRGRVVIILCLVKSEECSFRAPVWRALVGRWPALAPRFCGPHEQKRPRARARAGGGRLRPAGDGSMLIRIASLSLVGSAARLSVCPCGTVRSQTARRASFLRDGRGVVLVMRARVCCVGMCVGGWCFLSFARSFVETATTRTLLLYLLTTTDTTTTAPWLILPVVICLSQRLSHACLSASRIKAIPRMAQYISFGSLDLTQLLG